MAFPSELSQVARALNYDKQGDVSQVSISATVGVTSVGIGTTLPRYTLEVGAVGAAGTQLYVNGDARVVGVLSVGSGTITLDPNENKITVGTAATIDTEGFRIGSSFLHSTGIEADQFNVGLLTATTFQVNQQTVTNMSVTGVITASSAEFSGNVTIGGTLTYQDVINVDAIGIATARSGLRITNGGLDVVGVTTFQDNVNISGTNQLVFGNSNNATLYNDGTDTRFTSGGKLFLRGDLGQYVRIEDGSSNTLADFNSQGSVDLYYNNSKKFETTSSGINVVGTTTTGQLSVTGVSTFSGNVNLNADLDVDGHAEFDNVNIAGVLTATSATFSGDLTVGGVLKYEDVVNVDSVGIATARSGLRITDGGLDVVGVSTFNNNIDLNADLDVDGHTELDALNVSGVATATRFDGDLNALGKTYYVATTGSDSNSGDNINEPYLTIAQALSVAADGDIINVSSGTYEETVPLTVPRGVTLKGAGLRSTTIKPTDATKTNNILLLNDLSTVEDFTVKDGFYNSSTDTGYAFSYATGIAITTRSPYIQRVTILNKGSSTSFTDPYGYDTADSPPTSYIAGRGALIDGSKVASNSLEAGMLFNEVTFFTPNNKGVVLTNGARAEYLNCFHYFSSQAIVGTSGTVGIAGTAETRLKFRTPSVTPSVNDVVKLFDSGGSVVAVGTITNYDDPYAKISGKGYGTFTSVGIGTTQRVEFYQSDGTTFTGIASAISFADYTMFGAEMRSVGCAVEYGSQGVVADGVGVQLRLFAMNFNHVGSGKDMSNDPTTVIQANEVVELNSGQVSYVSIDQGGDFRVGDSLYINQETGQVSFASTSYDLENVGNLVVTDGGSNQTLITPTSLTVGNLQLAANTFSSTSGDITIDPGGSSETNVTGNLNVSGILTASVLEVSALQKGDTSISLTDTGSNGTIIFNTDGSEAFRINNQQVSVFTGDIDLNADIDVDGHTELDNVNVSGVLTAASATITGDLNVLGNLTYEDVTDVDSVGLATARAGLRITGGGLDVVGVTTFNDNVFLGDNDKINLGDGNDLQIWHNGSSSNITDAGTGSLYIGGNNDVVITDGSISETKAKFTTNGAVELYYDNSKKFETATSGVNIVGTTTTGQLNVSGVSTFQGNVNLGDNDRLRLGDSQDLQIYHDGSTSGSIDNTVGNLIIRNTAADKSIYISADNGSGSGTTGYIQANGITGEVTLSHYGIQKFATKSTGIDVTGTTNTDQLNVSGVSTFTGNIDANGDLDVDGHTELDNLNVSGVSTFQGDAYFGDNDYIRLGDATNGDLRIYHAGGAGSYIDHTNSNDLYIRVGSGSGSTKLRITDTSNNLKAIFDTDNTSGGVELYYGLNQKKFETTAGGIDVTGHAELDNVNISGVLTATSAEFSGNVTILGDLTYENVTNQDSIGIATARAGLRVTGGGLDVVGVSTFNDNVSVAGTFGVTGLSYFRDSIHVKSTSDSDRISLSSGALTFNGSGDLTIKNNTTTGHIILNTKTSTLANFFQGGAIELYHNNNKTLETTGAGVSITGGLDATGDSNIGTGGTTAFFDVSASRVGINSTIPEHTLDVDGSINSSTDVKIDGVSVLTTASDEAIALAIALG